MEYFDCDNCIDKDLKGTKYEERVCSRCHLHKAWKDLKNELWENHPFFKLARWLVEKINTILLLVVERIGKK